MFSRPAYLILIFLFMFWFTSALNIALFRYVFRETQSLLECWELTVLLATLACAVVAVLSMLGYYLHAFLIDNKPRENME